MRLRGSAFALLVSAGFLAFAVSAVDFQTAQIVDALEQSELVGNGVGAVSMPQSTITLLIGSLKITGEYYTAVEGGPRSAAHLVVGDSVQARTDKNFVYFVHPNGRTIKARIVRQERVTPPQ